MTTVGNQISHQLSENEIDKYRSSWSIMDGQKNIIFLRWQNGVEEKSMSSDKETEDVCTVMNGIFPSSSSRERWIKCLVWEMCTWIVQQGWR